MKVEKLEEFVMPTFPGKEAVKAEKICTLFIPIFNYVVNKLDLCDCDSEVGSSSSTK